MINLNIQNVTIVFVAIIVFFVVVYSFLKEKQIDIKRSRLLKKITPILNLYSHLIKFKLEKPYLSNPSSSDEYFFCYDANAFFTVTYHNVPYVLCFWLTMLF